MLRVTMLCVTMLCVTMLCVTMLCVTMSRRSGQVGYAVPQLAALRTCQPAYSRQHASMSTQPHACADHAGGMLMLMTMDLPGRL
jgi:hypothetical protein